MSNYYQHIAVYNDEYLIRETKQLYELVNIVECFSTRYVIRLELAYAELERRGYDITHTINITKKKENLIE